jgi:hypothetical protein
MFNLGMTLVCHLLASWYLKLPLWPSDLLNEAQTGELPFQGAARFCGDLLTGEYAYLRWALDSISLHSPSYLLLKAHKIAANVDMVLPELNLGAFSIAELRCHASD